MLRYPSEVGGVAKRCARCLEEKPTSEFCRMTSSKDGLHSYCRPCHRSAVTEWAKANPERRRVKQRISEQIRREANRDHCRSVARAWYSKNREKVSRRTKLAKKNNPQWALATKLRGLYGITLDQYRAMVSAQSGLCAICKRAPARKRLCVDHDHRTGKVRGLLCSTCNQAIGLLKEDARLLMSARDYLERYVSASDPTAPRGKDPEDHSGECQPPLAQA